MEKESGSFGLQQKPKGRGIAGKILEGLYYFQQKTDMSYWAPLLEVIERTSVWYNRRHPIPDDQKEWADFVPNAIPALRGRIIVLSTASGVSREAAQRELVKSGELRRLYAKSQFSPLSSKTEGIIKEELQLSEDVMLQRRLPFAISVDSLRGSGNEREASIRIHRAIGVRKQA